jgi:tetratricopeptide (TPR) repeat protein
VTDQNAVVVGEVCRRLDGIPLAIELAAARVRALSVENIAARLNDRFRLLTSGSRTALPRQQTLRALIDWSYDLLDQRERAVLRRLAVFAGGWTLDAVEAVAADGDVRESDVLDLLTHLVEKSLVVVEAGGGRYRLLDTVRQYAQERLTESGDEDSARMRHLACYVALAEKASPQLTGPQQGVWLSRLDLERENILGAHEYCARVAGGAELGLRLASAVKRYWIFRGLMELGHRITFEALQRRGADERNFHRCRVLFDAGQLGCWMGNYREAQSYLVESLDIAREISDKTMVAKVLQPLGLALQGLGDLVTARGYLEEALALAEKAGDKREIAGASNALAQLHRMQGHLDMSEPLYNNVVSLARELADGDLIAIGLLNLAMVAIGRESSDRVEQMLLEVLGIAEEIGSKPAGQSVLEVSAGLAALRGEWERVARLYGAAEAQTGHTGLHRDPADEAFLSPLITKAQTALGANQFATAESGGRALSYEQAMVEVRTWLEARP